MIDNRVASSLFPNSNKEVIEQGNGMQFNALRSKVYKNFESEIKKWNEWYGEGRVMQYLGDLHYAQLILQVQEGELLEF